MHNDGRSLGFSALVKPATQQPVPAQAELRLKTPSEFRYIGQGVPIVDMADICTGKAIFGIDARIPGMVYASIERPPATIIPR